MTAWWQALISTLLLGSMLPLLLLFLLRPAGYKLFLLADSKKVQTFFNNLKSVKHLSSVTSYSQGEILPQGLILGGTFLAYAHGSEGSSSYSRPWDSESRGKIYVLCTEKCMQEVLLKEKPLDRPPAEGSTKATEICLIERYGSYSYLYYGTRSITLDDSLSPRPDQQAIVETMVEQYKKKYHVSAFVSGATGTGKTTLGLFLAKALEGSLCTTFDPSAPGDSLQKVVHTAKPDKGTPLIIVLDEVDILLHKVHNREVGMHKDIPISVFDKRTFNKFFDDLFLFPHTIILMTSNVSKDVIDSWDKSYLRQGRVDICSYLIVPENKDEGKRSQAAKVQAAAAF